MNERQLHCDWSESAAAYLLDALDPGERSAFEAHLERCETCRAQLAELTPSVAMLAASVEPAEPPADLRSRLLARVNAEAELLGVADPEGSPGATRARAAQRRPRWLRLSPVWAAAVATVLLVVGGVAGALLAGDHEPATRVVPAQVAQRLGANARAELVVGQDFASLRVAGMRPPPPGRVYQVWLMRPGRTAPEPTNVLFSVRSNGSATVAVPTGSRRPSEVLVTAEPDGGSPQPTSKPVIAARL